MQDRADGCALDGEADQARCVGHVDGGPAVLAVCDVGGGAALAIGGED